jgi:hypothetical protein
VCHPNFAPRTDIVDGVETVLLTEDGAEICTPVRGCKDDQPADGGRYGPMCEPVPDDKLCAKHGDVGAVVAKPNNKLVLPATFTTMGDACSYDFECDSYNCMGFCAFGKGGPRQGALCRENCAYFSLAFCLLTSNDFFLACASFCFCASVITLFFLGFLSLPLLPIF